MAARDLRSCFTSQIAIPELIITTVNVMAVDASAVNAELESFSKEK